jgi:hypothetical protein
VDELQSTLNKEQKNPVDLDATAVVGADGRPAELMSVDTWYLLSSSSLKGAKKCQCLLLAWEEFSLWSKGQHALSRCLQEQLSGTLPGVTEVWF